jgi:hypothetical protein
MPRSEPVYRPSPLAVQTLCERLRHMGVSISESAARRLLEDVLAVEGPRLDSERSAALDAALETIRRAAQDALSTLQGTPSRAPLRDYELSFPPAGDAPTARGQPSPPASPPPALPPDSRHDDLPPRFDEEEGSRPASAGDDEPRPVFRRRRGR